jgi:hypothetical protein
MAELHLIGQIIGASEFAEKSLCCRWKLSSGGNPFSIEIIFHFETNNIKHRLFILFRGELACTRRCY